MCNALARRCCRFLPQSADPARGALFGGPPTESTGHAMPRAGGGGGADHTRASVYSRSSTRRVNLNGVGHGRRQAGGGGAAPHLLGLAQSDV
ncbi:Ubiquitin carboxyl-terminal hydrolase MINDY-2 [Frankliniella fusca]|uniref:Ubiquitin carboxyl-terminal hydrolase MINDY-2 n=1 Tax=Frankliniella fusca TaxID=407009 RepID=A0AAE1H1F0_9NEOP|nr:Ubiquitin carboxyl-terminal hydrolase MINDY-2 [Frankliniella fusca]